MTERAGPGAGGGQVDPRAARGYAWPPFEEGNQAATKHGAYSALRISQRSREIADVLALEAPGVPRTALEVVATTLARVEAADRALAEVDAVVADGGKELAPYHGEGAQTFERLRQDLRGWVSTALKGLGELGLTPAARARIEAALAGGSTDVTVNVMALLASSPEWLAVQDRIVAALQPHPAALDDVLRALGPGGGDDE